MTTPVRRLNHAVLFVSDVERAVVFYREALGLQVVSTEMDGRAVFLRSPTGATTTTSACSRSPAPRIRRRGR